MPVITPAYPSMCATHNVTQSTLQILKNELERGAAITERIMLGKGNWNELFEEHDFFISYRYYLQVIASSDSLEKQRLW
jgi:poly(A) polymerase